MKKRLLTILLMPFIILACSESGSNSNVSKVEPIYNPEAFKRGDYFAIPFPHFLRVTNGKIDIHDFPGFADNTMLRRVAEQLEKNFTGFGLNSAIFVPFTGELSERFLSISVTESVQNDTPLFLADITPGERSEGERIPILIKFYRGESKFLPPYTLIVMPMPGYPLKENHWYALIFKKGIKDSDGRYIVPPNRFLKDLYSGAPPYSYIKNIIPLNEVLFAVPFKTGIATKGLKAIARWYNNSWVKSKIEYKLDGTLRYAYYDYSPKPEIEGEFLDPQFQRGSPPFMKDGEGGFVFQSDGNPVVQKWEWVRFSILLPNAPPPPSGYPIVVYAHGTGGDFQTYIRNWVGYYLTEMGYAVIGFDQPLHGTRNPKHGGEDLYTFNFINPVAMRDNIRQGAADLFAVRTIIEKFSVPATESPTGWKIFFNLKQAGFFGHSQGALTGALYLAVENFSYRGAILSGSSGDLILAFLYKVSPVNIPAIFKIFLGEYDNYTLFNPVLSVFQILADPADPINYASRIIYHSGMSLPRNIFISEGLVDKETPPPLIEAFASNVGVDLVKPYYKYPALFSLKNIKVVDRPVAGNWLVETANGEAKVTSVIVQYPDYGHFACFDSEAAIRDWTQFMKSLLESRIAEIK